jgi:hypothetical protein
MRARFSGKISLVREQLFPSCSKYTDLSSHQHCRRDVVSMPLRNGRDGWHWRADRGAERRKADRFAARLSRSRDFDATRISRCTRGRRREQRIGVETPCTVPALSLKTGSVSKRSSGGCTGETVSPRSERQCQSLSEVSPQVETRPGQSRASGKLASFRPRYHPTKT